MCPKDTDAIPEIYYSMARLGALGGLREGKSKPDGSVSGEQTAGAYAG